MFATLYRDLNSIGQQDLTESIEQRRSLKQPTQPSLFTMASEQVVTMNDGVRIPYRFDGSEDPNAPLIVLSNPSLVDLTVWDDFVHLFLAESANKKYRILRYNNRGRTKHSEENPLSVGLLTDDVVAILDAIKVEKAAVVSGMSLGAMAALDLAIRYENRVACIVPCDLFPVAPKENRQMWSARVEISEKDPRAPKGPDGARQVGRQVAKSMVHRWLSPTTFDAGEREQRVPHLTKLAHDNRLDGLKSIVDAISSYDLLSGIEDATVPALFIAGEADKPVHPGMTELSKRYGGKGAEFKIIPEAGHLPGWERPAELVKVFSSFLSTQEQHWK